MRVALSLTLLALAAVLGAASAQQDPATLGGARTLRVEVTATCEPYDVRLTNELAQLVAAAPLRAALGEDRLWHASAELALALPSGVPPRLLFARVRCQSGAVLATSAAAPPATLGGASTLSGHGVEVTVR